MDVAPWIRVFGAILDTVPSACYKSFGLRSIKDADVLSEKKNYFSAYLQPNFLHRLQIAPGGLVITSHHDV